MSIWIILELGAKLSNLPVALSENLIKSLSFIESLATFLPCIPSMPNAISSVSSIAPLPSNDVMTGALIK